MNTQIQSQPNESLESEARRVAEASRLELTVSSKLVLTVLAVEGPLTQKELASETRLSQRTVRQALRGLIEEGVVEKRPYVFDARMSTYSIALDSA